MNECVINERKKKRKEKKRNILDKDVGFHDGVRWLALRLEGFEGL